tara:strand:+ start:592874 stop:596008 length:3135 start_codon:yes stop_codon:yes gene_type:complete
MPLIARILCIAVFIASACCCPFSVSADEIHFGRDVRPILAKHCFTCHGPDEGAREADLRLDTEAGATTDLGGYRAVQAGDPDASELFLRVTSDDDDLRMPPADSSAALSESEIETLRKWIESGGRYTEHWAFVPPQSVAIPEVESGPWCRTPIDAFVLRRMHASGVAPADAADKHQLVRRLYLDLTGVNPTPEEAKRFIADDHPAAYSRLVDRLLASPAYAERFTRPWLDLARYSDTNGYEKDRNRTIWPYRDWVIKAIAEDMPFDQFSIEQLAGDMLPSATKDQRIATGFHRNTMLNEEGGIDPLEYRFYAMVDRVATTGTVWMGLTTGCAQCHTHKYDPITHTDYYSLLAMMNQADEPEETVADTTTRITQRKIENEIRAEEIRLSKRFLPTLAESGLNDMDCQSNSDDCQSIDSDQTPANASAGVISASATAGPQRDEKSGDRAESIAGLFVSMARHAIDNVRDWSVIQPTEMHSTKPFLRRQKDGSILATGDVTKRDIYRIRFELDETLLPATALRLEVLPHPLLPASGPGMAFYEGRRGDFFLSELTAKLDGNAVSFADASHSYGKISVGRGAADAANVIDGEGSTGWSTSGAEGKANRLILNLTEPIQSPGSLEIELLFERHFAAALGRFRFSVTGNPSRTEATQFPADVDHAITSAVLQSRPLDSETYARMQRHFVRSSDSLRKYRKKLDALYDSIPQPVRTLVMRERVGRDHRTTYRHHRGEYLSPKEEVQPAIPAVFGKLDSSRPANRLTLAQWLVSEDNPLAARVTVNRAWRAIFGTGIVRTAGDFGTQSEPPTHPELLDWLALDLIHNGWSIKRLHRQIVLSSTYRQSVAAPTPGDPNQRLLAGFPHRRLDAEQVRDVMLSAANLLNNRVGGPSVYPPQPAGVIEMAYGNPVWPTSTGGDRYRRSLYTFSKRTAPFAAFATFDAPSGELCVARRDHSTTPLQALTLMNDEMYLEMARGLSESVQRRIDGDSVAADELPEKIVTEMFWRLFVREPTAQERSSVIDFYQRQKTHDEPWTLVARALMNTDEAITTP